MGKEKKKDGGQAKKRIKKIKKKEEGKCNYLLMFSERMYSTRSMIAELIRLSFG